MSPKPVSCSSNCRLDLSDVQATIKRYDDLCARGVCPHISKSAPASKAVVTLYAVMDSNCYRSWDLVANPKDNDCDKEDGQWLWLILRGLRRRAVAIPVDYSVKSLDPTLLQFASAFVPSAALTAEYTPKNQIWLRPYYSQREDLSQTTDVVTAVRCTSDQYRRVPVEIKVKIGIDGDLNNRIHTQEAHLAIVIKAEGLSSPPGYSVSMEQPSPAALVLGIKSDLAELAKYEHDLRNAPFSRAAFARAMQNAYMSLSHYEQAERYFATEAAAEQREAFNSFEKSLAELKDKLRCLRDEQADLFRVLSELKANVLSHFASQDITAVSVITDQLRRSGLADLTTMLNAFETGQLTESELQESLRLMQKALPEINVSGVVRANMELDSAVKDMAAVASDPELSVAHKLKYCLPIIPFFLSYEGEIALSSKLDIARSFRKLMNRLTGTHI